MKLITKEIEKKFAKHPFGSQKGKGLDAEVLLKIFNPYGLGTWLVTEAERRDDDWHCFGYMNLFGEWSWDCFSIKDIEEIRVSVFGVQMKLERDRYCFGNTVGGVLREMGASLSVLGNNTKNKRKQIDSLGR